MVDQNSPNFNIALEKTESNLAYNKFWDKANLSAIVANIFAIKKQSIAIIVILNKDDYTDKIFYKEKLLAFQFAYFFQNKNSKFFIKEFYKKWSNY